MNITPLDITEREAILKALEQLGGNRRATARALHISTRSLSYKLRQYAAQGITLPPTQTERLQAARLKSLELP